MNDPFCDFEAVVAPDYQWSPWLNEAGQPLKVARRGFYSLESALAVELTRNRQDESGERTGPVLEPKVRPNEAVRRYQPMARQTAALFKLFAEVDYRSLEQIRQFALKYGLLGVPIQSQAISYTDAEGTPRYHTVNGESFLDWSLEICLMREGIWLSDKKRSDLDESRLSWLFDRNLQHVQARLRITEARGRRLSLAPLKLISAMWLQLALAITGDKRYIACKFCRKPFEISTEQTGFRSHREFCSDSCKTQDYRRRKRLALALVKEGVDVAQAARQIETDVATVRRWLASVEVQAQEGKA